MPITTTPLSPKMASMLCLVATMGSVSGNSESWLLRVSSLVTPEIAAADNRNIISKVVIGRKTMKSPMNFMLHLRQLLRRRKGLLEGSSDCGWPVQNHTEVVQQILCTLQRSATGDIAIGTYQQIAGVC